MHFLIYFVLINFVFNFKRILRILEYNSWIPRIHMNWFNWIKNYGYPGVTSLGKFIYIVRYICVLLCIQSIRLSFIIMTSVQPYVLYQVNLYIIFSYLDFHGSYTFLRKFHINDIIGCGFEIWLRKSVYLWLNDYLVRCERWDRTRKLFPSELSTIENYWGISIS